MKKRLGTTVLKHIHPEISGEAKKKRDKKDPSGIT